MDKIITFAVPCYNSAAYMDHCVETLLKGGEDIEIILVDDGSTKDNTHEKCDEWAAKYPDIIRAIHQENGGHGEGVNQGIRNARGLYYKVVDSDDWLDEAALQTVLDKLRQFAASDNPVDLFIANYVYEHVEDNTQKVMRYTNVFPQNRVFTWNDIGRFRPSQYLLMHSVIYRTQLLRDCGLELPKHTFYVDNIFVYQPLPSVRTMYYMDVNFYRYFIGREDQSVSRKNIVARYKQQVGVTDIMIRCYRYAELKAMHPHLRRYMKHDVNVLMCLSLMFTTGGKTERKERKATLKRMWSSIREEDPEMYRFLRHRSYIALICWMPFSWQRFFTTVGYCYFSKKLKCS